MQSKAARAHHPKSPAHHRKSPRPPPKIAPPTTQRPPPTTQSSPPTTEPIPCRPPFALLSTLRRPPAAAPSLLQVESKFQKAYTQGVHKSKYW